MARKSIAVMVAISLMLLALPTNANEGIKKCPTLEVRSIATSTLFEKAGTIISVDSSSPKIVIVPAQMPLIPNNSGEKKLTVIAMGPILGSMDSNAVETECTCTSKGLSLTATILRSADFHGAALKNVTWRPRIEMEIVLHSPDATIEAIWRMKLTSGEVLDHAQTPGHQNQKYPITVTTIIR